MHSEAWSPREEGKMQRKRQISWKTKENWWGEDLGLIGFRRKTGWWNQTWEEMREERRNSSPWPPMLKIFNDPKNNSCCEWFGTIFLFQFAFKECALIWKGNRVRYDTFVTPEKRCYLRIYWNMSQFINMIKIISFIKGGPMLSSMLHECLLLFSSSDNLRLVT